MNITIQHSTFDGISEYDKSGVYGLRFEVFKKRLGWEVPADGEFESDDYDDANAEYLYAKDEATGVVGCWRLIPTTCRYMLEDTFSNLLGDQPAPKARNIVELSRFAVKKNSSSVGVNASEVTMKMLQSIYLHGVENGIDEYITVTSTAIERLLSRLGVPFKRMGDQQVHLLGETKSVVLSVPVNAVFRQAVLN